MRLFNLFILMLFSTLMLHSQIDFNVLMSKKALKKSLSRIYEYSRGWSVFDCLSGDCENGEGIFHSRGSYYYMYAKGQFRDGKLNGQGTIYIFNTKASVASRDSFVKALLSKDELPKYFGSERCPDEVYKGTFTNNILEEGNYNYYGTGNNRQYQFTKMTMYYLNSLEIWLDYDTKTSMYLYEYTGDFKQKDALYVILDLKKEEDQISISNTKNKSIVTPTHKKGVFNLRKYIDNKVVSSESLENEEGKSPYIRSVSSKPEKVIKNIKFRCHICQGKGEEKRKFWILRTFEERRANNGYMRDVLIKTEVLEYVPGRRPMTTNKQTAKIEERPITCGTCKGTGYRE